MHTIGTYTINNEPVYLFRITNRSGSYVELTNWGARWITACIPDKNGKLANVLAGYDDLKDYLTDEYYMGTTIGRFANRIANASFTIDNVKYNLEANDGRHSNHGGTSGSHRKLWQWEELPDGVRFMLDSPDGEGGYPGNIHISVEYRWSEENSLTIRYWGTTDKKTYLNLTNHAYFNLSGTTNKITKHQLTVPTEWMLDTTPECIPTGKIVHIAGTPFDFTSGKFIGKDLYADDSQLKYNKGYNHCYVLRRTALDEKVCAAQLNDPETGRRLTIETDLPGVLLYTAGYYKNPDTAVCLETQFFPDTSSHSHFPSCMLSPGEEYKQQTIYKFSIEYK